MSRTKPKSLKECDETGYVECRYLKVSSSPGCLGSKLNFHDKSENVLGRPKCKKRNEFQEEYYNSLRPEEQKLPTTEERMIILKELRTKYDKIDKYVRIGKIVETIENPYGNSMIDVSKAFEELEILLKEVN